MDLLLQLQADQLDVPVTRSSHRETTAAGAAYLAGLAEGVWGSAGEVADAWTSDHTAMPASDRGGADRSYQRWLQAVTRSRGWAR
jgi:glycerol kinase